MRRLLPLLIGRRPSSYTVEKYVDGHASIPYVLAGGMVAEDSRVLEFARRNPRRARIGDAWSRLTAPHSPLRQKLVLVVPFSSRPKPTSLCPDGSGGIAGAFAAIAGFGLAAALGVARFAPPRMLSDRRR